MDDLIHCFDTRKQAEDMRTILGRKEGGKETFFIDTTSYHNRPIYRLRLDLVALTTTHPQMAPEQVVQWAMRLQGFVQGVVYERRARRTSSSKLRAGSTRRI